jgi:hypothetical protein
MRLVDFEFILQKMPVFIPFESTVDAGDQFEVRMSAREN